MAVREGVALYGSQKGHTGLRKTPSVSGVSIISYQHPKHRGFGLRGTGQRNPPTTGGFFVFPRQRSLQWRTTSVGGVMQSFPLLTCVELDELYSQR
jgi:hypothetical protein